MLIQQQNTKLMSLLLVFLSENYSTELRRCNVCDTTTPRFERSFFISGQWVCVDCILARMNGIPYIFWN